MEIKKYILIAALFFLLSPIKANAAGSDGITVITDVNILLTLTDTSEGKCFTGTGEIYAMSENPATHRFVSVTLPDAYIMQTPAGEKPAPDGTEVSCSGSMNARRGYVNYQSLNSLNGKSPEDAIKGTISVSIPFSMDFKDYGAGDYSLSIPVMLTMRKAYGSYSSDLYFTPWEKLLEEGEITVTDGTLSSIHKEDMILEIDPSVMALQGNVFIDSSYTEVAIPSSVATGKDAFAQSGVETIFFDDDVTEIPEQICCNAKHLVKCSIPDAVMTINNAAFSGCTQLSDFDFPGALTSLGSTAFASCTSLDEFVMHRDITFPGGLGRSSPFYQCKLKRIIVEEGVTTIQANLFYDGCSELTELILPATVTTIAGGAFNNAVKLETLEIKSNLTKPSNTPFSNSGIKSLTFAEGVTTIPQSLFAGGCSNMEEILLPSTLTSIGQYAFENAKNLREVTVRSEPTVSGFSRSPFEGAGIETVYFSEDVTKVPAYLFRKACSNMTELSVPSHIVSLGDYAFGDNSALKKVTINSDINKSSTSSTSPFAGSKIEEIVISEGVTTVGRYLFSEATGAATTIQFPSTLTRVNQYAFRGMGAMDELNLPSSLTYVESHAFAYGKGVGRVIVNSDIGTPGSWSNPFEDTKIEQIIVSEGVTKVGSYLFRSGLSVCTDISFPSTLSRIEAYAFYGCKALDTLDLPQSLTYLGDHAFGGADTIQTVILRSNVANGGSWNSPFGDSKITQVIVIDGVTQISGYTFKEGASVLTDLFVPVSLTAIGTNAFYGGDNVTVHYAGSEEQWAFVAIARDWTPVAVLYGESPP